MTLSGYVGFFKDQNRTKPPVACNVLRHKNKTAICHAMIRHVSHVGHVLLETSMKLPSRTSQSSDPMGSERLD
jgi:hypothetical protein